MVLLRRLNRLADQFDWITEQLVGFRFAKVSTGRVNPVGLVDRSNSAVDPKVLRNCESNVHCCFPLPVIRAYSLLSSWQDFHSQKALDFCPGRYVC